MIDDISLLLLVFGIRNSKTKNKFNGHYINITGRKNLEIFQNKIGFSHPKRAKKLEDILKSYKS